MFFFYRHILLLFSRFRTWIAIKQRFENLLSPGILLPHPNPRQIDQNSPAWRERAILKPHVHTYTSYRLN